LDDVIVPLGGKRGVKVKLASFSMLGEDYFIGILGSKFLIWINFN